MPAIQLARLRHQTALLVTHFSEPAIFIRECEALFEFYADRTQRTSLGAQKAYVIDRYNVPIQVIRRILLELMPLAEAEPEKAYALAQACWEQKIFEYLLLATRVLNFLPLTEKENVIKQALFWIHEKLDDIILKHIASDSFEKIRLNAPTYLIDNIEQWLLVSNNKEEQRFALIMLDEMVKYPAFENLPAVYRIQSSYLSQISQEMRPYILTLIKTLVKRSPQETAFFLRQHYTLNPQENIAWIIRQSLGSFPDDIKSFLRETLKSASKQT